MVNLTDIGNGNLPSGKDDIGLYKTGIKISLRGNGKTIKNTVAQDRIFTVMGSLILRDITLDGDGKSISRTLVEVNGGTFIMDSGARIINSICGENSAPGAVEVGQGGTFYMKGGEISGNRGGTGAVMVKEGNFYKTGGTITGNTWYMGTHYGDQVHVWDWTVADTNPPVYQGKFINAALGPNDNVSVKANFDTDGYSFLSYTYEGSKWQQP